MIPAEITAGELAQLLGISERRVATLKAEGRVPTSPVGRILLPELVAALYRECADHRSRLASHGPRERHGRATMLGEMDRAEAFNAGLGMAANIGARLALGRALGTPISEDAEEIARAAVAEACVAWFEIAPTAP